MGNRKRTARKGKRTAARRTAKKTARKERDEKEEGWTFKARVNRGLMLWEDHGGRGGIVRRRSGVYFVEPDMDNAGGEVEGKYLLGGGWEATIKNWDGRKDRQFEISEPD